MRILWPRTQPEVSGALIDVTSGGRNKKHQSAERAIQCELYIYGYNNVPETRQCKSSLLLGVYIYRCPVSTQAVSSVVFVRLVVYFVPMLGL